MESAILVLVVQSFRTSPSSYRVLRAAQDSRAPEILTTAHRLLHEQAAKISDEEMRRSFLENVAVHREIVAAFESQSDRPRQA